MGTAAQVVEEGLKARRVRAPRARTCGATKQEGGVWAASPKSFQRF
jgi:hypothetical protein